MNKRYRWNLEKSHPPILIEPGKCYEGREHRGEHFGEPRVMIDLLLDKATDVWIPGILKRHLEECVDEPNTSSSSPNL